MSERAKDDAKSPSSMPARKPYRAPALVQWGTLREVTMAIGKTSKSGDSGTAKGNKQTH